MLDWAGFSALFACWTLLDDAGQAAGAGLPTTPRIGCHDPRGTRDAARPGAGMDAVPVARSTEHRGARADAAHAAHGRRAIRHRIRHRAVAYAGRPAAR